MPQNATLTAPTGQQGGHFDAALAAGGRILDTLIHRIGKDARAAKPHDWLAATDLTVRDQIIDRWMVSTRAAHAAGAKRVYYLSLEFLIGRLLRDALSNLGVVDEVKRGAGVARRRSRRSSRSSSPTRRSATAAWAGWRPASWRASRRLDLPAYGYGIRYVNGMFRQRIDDGWQVELPETWLAHGNPWEFERRESAYLIGFGGEVIGQRRRPGPRGSRPRRVERDGGRHAGGRLARQARQHAAAVDRARARSDPARRVQRRRPHRRAGRAERAPRR